MSAEYKRISDTEAEFEIKGTEAQLKEYKKITLKRMQPEVSAPGFRKGKVPLNIVEKHVDQNYLKSQVVDDALTALYREALKDNDVRPLSQPQVEIKKFVPFTEIEFKVTVEVVPPIKLADYKKIKKQAVVAKVEAKDISEVLDNLRKRTAKKEEVERAAKDGDEAVIDFKGTTKDGKEVAGASGTDYPLAIGSSTFIDGFEENVVGMKKDDNKKATLTFPKDYAHKPLAGKDVIFDITVKSVQEIKLPKADDDFAASVGPFKTMKELKDDIKKQLVTQKEQEADGVLKDEIIGELVKKSKLTAPKVLIDENIEALLADFKQNLVYRGITFPEYLEQAKQTEEEYRDNDLQPRAEDRVKTGLVLTEVAKLEKVEVTDEELEIRIQLLKGQYQNDAKMMAELDNPDAKGEIASRMATEKTVDLLVKYAS